MRPLLLLAGVMATACYEGAAPSANLQEADPELTYARGRQALADKGITSLRWGLTPYVSTTSTQAQYQPTVDLVASRIGVPIEISVGESYSNLEQLLIGGEIDIATMSPYAYVQAKEIAPEIQVFATHISGGSQTYGGYIVAREDSQIHTILDVAGRRFAFVDPRSSSGWLFPASRLLDSGLHPVDGVTGMFYGSHAAVIEAVTQGKAAAGATYGGALEQGRGSIPGAKPLRIVARTKRIPLDAYVAGAGLPPAAREALQLALSTVSTRDSVGREVLRPLLGLNGFMPATDSHYKGVRTVDVEVRAALKASGSGLPPTVQLPPEAP